MRKLFLPMITISLSILGTVVFVETAHSIPDAPTGLTATASGNTINLSWRASTTDGVTNYQVERCTADICSIVATVRMDVTSYSDTGLNKSTTYTYKVKAEDATGFSATATEARATTPQFAIQGANFGASVGFTAIPSQRLVKSARLVDGIVRVDDESNKFQPNAMVEAHYFFQQKAKFLGMVDNELWGHGPFIAVQPGDNVIQAVAFGWMVGFKHSKDASSSWNIGAGAVLNPSVQVLGDGITKNQPLPSGETELRFKNTSLWGYVLLISFSWN